MSVKKTICLLYRNFNTIKIPIQRKGVGENWFSPYRKTASGASVRNREVSKEHISRAERASMFVLVLFISVAFLAPSIALAINHEYVGCVKGGINKTNGTCGTSQERRVCYEGMVPCGKAVAVASSTNEDVHWDEKTKVCLGGSPVIVNCQLCHFFVIIDGIMDFILVDIVPPLTVAVLVIGGAMFYLSGFKPELQNKSKTLFKGVLIGLLLIYGAYMIIGIFLMVLGAAEMNPLKDVFDSTSGIFSITCPVEVP